MLRFGYILLLCGLISCIGNRGDGYGPSRHPVYRETFDAGDRVRSGIALGGLGTGSVELRKDGQFYNWTILNNWPLGTGEPLEIRSYPRTYADQSFLFFIVRYESEGESPRLKLLQLNDGLSEGGMQGIDYYYPWMRAVETIEYSARFPFTNMKFSDPEMPFEIYLEAFSPFVPHDVKNSSLPGAYFNFSIKSTADKPVKVLLVASLRNLAGYDQLEKYFISSADDGRDYKGFTMSCGGMDSTLSSWGEMGIYSLSAASSYYLGWEHKHPYYERLLVDEKFEDINDTEGRNWMVNGTRRARTAENNDQRCFSSIGTDTTLQPGGSFDHAFVFAWYFPNLYGGIEQRRAGEMTDGNFSLNIQKTRIQGHYYNNFFSSHREVSEYLMAHRKDLEEKTRDFFNDFYNSDLPTFVLDQVNSQLNTFVTSSTLTRNGTFAIREGLTSDKPWGPNATIDVSLYGSSSIIALFPELQKSMMRAHSRIQTPKGEIHHGLPADIEIDHNRTSGVFHRVDLVPNYIQMVLRDYFWTGDREYLLEMWPSIKKGIHYILDERDNDGDRMPDMEGIMSSYDNFPMYGLASYIQSQWLAAMASSGKIAGILGDTETQALAEKILREGTRLMETQLWNGKYFVLSNDYLGEKGLDDGILTDQLVGQWMAHQSGLGYLFGEDKIRSSLQAIMHHCYLEDFGLRNCSWPAYPDLYPIHTSNLWVDQANTCWSGVELAFASLLIYEGMVGEGEKVIKTVNDRYRDSGLYWDHQEFGGHYYRPMSAWSILHAYLGLGISDGTYCFSPKLGTEQYTLFFSHGNGTAHYLKKNDRVRIQVQSGSMRLKALRLEDSGLKSPEPGVFINDRSIDTESVKEGGIYYIQLPDHTFLNRGDILEIRS
jgi:uncharacterized protein (DUF608 family)